jgi:hypothetical protein
VAPVGQHEGHRVGHGWEAGREGGWRLWGTKGPGAGQDCANEGVGLPSEAWHVRVLRHW